jgi:two-component system cell cycle response regulator
MNDQTDIKPKPKAPPKKQGERKPCLIMVEGDFLGEVYPLDLEVIVLGRSDDADVSLVDTGVSRRHATIEKKEEQFQLSDLQSTNGTLVNGNPITTINLNDGDKISVGSTVLRFCFQDEIDNEYHQKLRSMAIRDGLTRIFNKRHFEEVLDREFKYCTRHNRILSIVILDIDHFKEVNDKYGHPAGDMVLKTLAQTLAKEVRGYDVFARSGGEEFSFLLRELTTEQAFLFAERVRKNIESFPFTYEDETIPVTVSLGVSTYCSTRSFADANALVADADKYLYEAKNKGRNQVCSPLSDTDDEVDKGE